MLPGNRYLRSGPYKSNTLSQKLENCIFSSLQALINMANFFSSVFVSLF